MKIEVKNTPVYSIELDASEATLLVALFEKLNFARTSVETQDFFYGLFEGLGTLTIAEDNSGSDDAVENVFVN